jgi:hypothetical protein
MTDLGAHCKDYQGWAKGHFGDSIQYVDDNGGLKVIPGASSSWGCSHNTGIAFEAADSPPFASVCAEDHRYFHRVPRILRESFSWK